MTLVVVNPAILSGYEGLVNELASLDAEDWKVRVNMENPNVQ
jgi:hypothetical protein